MRAQESAEDKQRRLEVKSAKIGLKRLKKEKKRSGDGSKKRLRIRRIVIILGGRRRIRTFDLIGKGVWGLV
jgi:hypothetical protein